jgi:hypothetical protein
MDRPVRYSLLTLEREEHLTVVELIWLSVVTQTQREGALRLVQSVLSLWSTMLQLITS